MNRRELLLISIGLGVAATFIWGCRFSTPEIPLFIPLTINICQVILMTFGSSRKK